MAKLENVFLAVDDGEGAVGVPPADVARIEPTVPEALRTGTSTSTKNVRTGGQHSP